MDVTLLSYFVGHIDAHIKDKNSGMKWFFTIFYCNPVAELRIHS